MAKFNKSVRNVPTSPIRSSDRPSGTTHEGAPGFARDAKSELYLMAVTNMVGEFTFYESAKARDGRYASLCREVAVADPQWMAGFLPWLRGVANMRSAPLVGALEAAKAMVDNGIGGGRQLVDSVLKRADEPGEALAYWTSVHGRAIPKPVKRGIADAARRLYNERSLLKYDTDSKGFRFGDVLELTHPSPDPAKPWQGELFSHALDRRRSRAKPVPDGLAMLHARKALMHTPPPQRAELLRRDVAAQLLAEAGMTWEALAGWLREPLDRHAWQAVIPSMGYMALLRNLRNFDQAEVDDETAAKVAARLADPKAVAASKQLPMRFLSAYRSVPSLRWGHALETALEHSLSNVPWLSGETLILVDTSGSMASAFSADGKLRRWDAAVVFGLALARRCERSEVVSFASPHGRTPGSTVFPRRRGEALLTGASRWKTDGYFLNTGTDTEGAVRRHYRRHDRVVILTDEQASRHRSRDVTAAVPHDRPVYTWNLVGDRLGHAPSGSNRRHTFGGLSDTAFGQIQLLEAHRDADWPWLTG